MNNFSSYTLSAIEVAKKAGELLKEGFHSKYKITNKEGIHNLVTEYDIKSEKFIAQELKAKFPKSCFLGEEEGASEEKSDLKWIVDPIDGTVNFAHHIPFFCISIALQKNSEIISGVVYSPLLDELFVAEKNKGAFCQDQKIEASKISSVEKAILSTGFPYNLKDNPEQCIDRFMKFLKLGIPIRRLGSAAMDMCYVAAGRFDGFWETNLGPWDCAAGKLMVEEAGGKISKWDGSEFVLGPKNTLIASNGKIHETLVNMLQL